MNEFEQSDFYQKLEFGSQESFEEALDLISQNKVDVHLCSSNDDTEGWTYLHYVVDKLVFLHVFYRQSTLLNNSLVVFVCHW